MVLTTVESETEAHWIALIPGRTEMGEAVVVPVVQDVVTIDKKTKPYFKPWKVHWLSFVFVVQ